MEWKTIDSAPMDKELLVIDAYGHMHVAEYIKGNGWGTDDGGGYHYLNSVTYWMPLPDKPLAINKP